MDASLQLLLDQLSTANSLCSHSDSTAAFRSKFTAGEFLKHICVSQMPADEFVTVTSCVLETATADWLLSGVDADSTPDAANSASEQLFSDLSAGLCRHGCLPSLMTTEDACQDLRSKFAERTSIACRAMAAFSHVLTLLASPQSTADKSCSRINPRVIRVLSCGGLLVCLEHDQGCGWFTPQSTGCSTGLLSAICSANKCDSLELLLNSSYGKFSYMQHVLAEVLPKLARDTWKLNPAASHVFRRCLLAVRQPLLSEFLPMLLPPTLLFIDDFEADNRLSGLHCLQHVLQHASKTELRWFGRADVIYDSLLRSLFGCDHVTLEVVIFCLFDVLDIIELSPRRTTAPRTWGKHDDVFEKYLTNMEMESKIPFRRVYAKHLGAFVTKLGIVVVRHLTRLIRVVVDYLQISDGPTEESRSDVLNALSVVMSEAWPRIPGHADNIMKALVRLLHDVRRQNSEMTSAEMNLRCRALDCVQLLKTICPEYYDLNDDFLSQI